MAGYGQLLRDDPALPADYNWDRVRSIAVRSVGDDPQGLRREFMDLVQLASRSPTLNESGTGGR